MSDQDKIIYKLIIAFLKRNEHNLNKNIGIVHEAYESLFKDDSAFIICEENDQALKDRIKLIEQVKVDQILEYLRRNEHNSSEDFGIVHEAYESLFKDDPAFIICKENDQVLKDHLEKIKQKKEDSGYKGRRIDVPDAIWKDKEYSETKFLEKMMVSTLPPVILPGQVELTPLSIERKEIDSAIEVIESCFGLPFLEKEAYILRIKNKMLVNQLNALKDHLISLDKNLEEIKTYKKSEKSKNIKSIEQKISKIKEEILLMEEQINDFKDPIKKLIILREQLNKEKNDIIKKEKDYFKNIDSSKKPGESKSKNKTEKTSDKLMKEIEKIEKKINDIKRPLLSTYYHEEGISQLQKRAFFRIKDNWQVIKPKVISWLKEKAKKLQKKGIEVEDNLSF